MSQEIEIEYKNLLTKEEFNRLLASFPFPKESQCQVNYYFETKDFSLRKNKSALRIRKKNKTYTLTLKQPHPEGLLETNDRLTKQEAINWMEGNIKPKQHTTHQLHQLGISPHHLIFYGYLETERRELLYKDVLLVLDYSTYNNHSDYELEIEAPSKEISLNMFNKILGKYHIQKKDTPNKIERFFSTV